MSSRIARIVLAIYLIAIYASLAGVRVVTNSLRDRGMLRGAVAIAFALAASGAIALILRNPKLRTKRNALKLLAIGAVYASAIVPMQSPEEKIHFIEYGLVALLALASWPHVRRPYITSAIFTLAAGWIDEGIQGLLPTRFYDLRDVAFNAAAGVLALVAIFFFRDGNGRTDRSEEMALDAARGRARGDGS
ncbi:MAG TPA: VanZ family protein [Thermoanaerobaculia bacterium]|jgi:VanZ family protein